MNSYQPTNNFGYGTVLVAPSPALTGTTLTLQPNEGSNFPDPATEGQYQCTIWPPSDQPVNANAEIVTVTGKSGDILTITRAQEGTDAQVIETTCQIALTFTDEVHQALAQSSLFKVIQVAHGFGAGEAIYHDGSIWALAQSDTEATLGTHLVGSVYGADTFVAVISGRVEIASHGLTPGGLYYVSNTTPGALTTTKPGAPLNPILVVEDANTLTVLAFSGVGALADSFLGFFNGTFVETFNALVTATGGVVTLSLEQSGGGGDLTMNFSDGQATLDTTPAATVTLNAGTNTSPQANYVYILQSDKTITVSTSDFPNDVEHIKIGYFFVPSAAYVESDGVYINQNWNDHLQYPDDGGMGHLAHLAERSRRDGAYYFSGIDANGTDQAAASSYFDYVSAAESYFKSTSGVIFQMHRHATSAIDTRTDDIHVVNWSGDNYHVVNDLTAIVADSAGGSLSNKYFNLFFFAVGNKAGEYSPMMCQLPSGSYSSASSAQNDVDGFDNLSMPRQFSLDSSTGIPVCRMTLRYSGGTGTLTHIATTDLRSDGLTAGGGSSGTTTNFADNQFSVFDEADITKILNFDVGTNVTTGATRTLTVPDDDGTIALIGGGSINTAGTLRIDTSSTVLDLNPSGTSSQDVIDITPSASLEAGSTWRAIKIDGNALDPATGAASDIHMLNADFGSFASVDGNATLHVIHFDMPPSDSSTGIHINVSELTNNSTVRSLYTNGGALVLSATATYVGHELDFSNFTRDGGAPVLQGLNISLPADYTDFGTSFGGEFTGGGDIVTIVDGTFALNVTGTVAIKSQNELRFYDNGNYVGFEAPALSADQIWVLPAADGASGEHLETDGAGTLSWGASGSSGTDGWTAAGETWVWVSADGPIFTFKVVGVDLTGKYSDGMFFRVSQATGGTKYFILHDVSFSTDTTFTVYGGTDYTLENETISDPFWALSKGAFGFPGEPDNWTEATSDTGSYSQSSPTQNVWYNGFSVSMPIGSWVTKVMLGGFVQDTIGQLIDLETTLSTANNSEVDGDFTGGSGVRVSGTTTKRSVAASYREKVITVTSKTTQYANYRTIRAGITTVSLRGAEFPNRVDLVNAYL